ncbi:MAG: hypothetical protein LAO05_15865 [Acidobacteriia bacterium]|nr:hypothetical protein [Terriglobia bacterium]
MQTAYSYPRASKLRNALDLVIWAWLFAAGVYFVIAYPLTSWKAYLAVGVVMAYFGFLCYMRGREQLVLSRTFEVLDHGLRVTQWGKELATIPWSEVRELRNVGRHGDCVIVSGFLQRPILVHRRLNGLDEFRTAVQRRASPPPGQREQNPQRGGA